MERRKGEGRASTIAAHFVCTVHINALIRLISRSNTCALFAISCALIFPTVPLLCHVACWISHSTFCRCRNSTASASWAGVMFSVRPTIASTLAWPKLASPVSSNFTSMTSSSICAPSGTIFAMIDFALSVARRDPPQCSVNLFGNHCSTYIRNIFVVAFTPRQLMSL